MNGRTYKQEYAAEDPSGGSVIDTGTDSEAVSGDLKVHQFNVTLLSAVIEPDTYNTKMVYIYQSTALSEVGFRLTNDLYDGVLTPNNN